VILKEKIHLAIENEVLKQILAYFEYKKIQHSLNAHVSVTSLHP
jgi:hypothetical protein